MTHPVKRLKHPPGEIARCAPSQLERSRRFSEEIAHRHETGRWRWATASGPLRSPLHGIAPEPAWLMWLPEQPARDGEGCAALPQREFGVNVVRWSLASRSSRTIAAWRKTAFNVTHWTAPPVTNCAAPLMSAGIFCPAGSSALGLNASTLPSKTSARPRVVRFRTFAAPAVPHTPAARSAEQPGRGWAGARLRCMQT